MSSSGSKYSVINEMTLRKIELLKAGIDDSVRQKEIEAELNRIDNEIQQDIEEIKSTPVDAELTKKQAKSDLDSAKVHNKRMAMEMVGEAECEMDEAKAEYERAKKRLEIAKEASAEAQKKADLKAMHEYEKAMTSVDNVEQTIKLRVQKAKMEGEKRKKDLNIELERLKAKTSAQKAIIDCQDKGYEDVLKVSTLAVNSGAN